MTRTSIEQLRVGFLEDPADLPTVRVVTNLINTVYAEAENSMWGTGTTRTDVAEIVGLIEARELVAARLDGTPVGCLRVVRVDATTVELGMVSADPDVRGRGIGRALVAFAENKASLDGYDTAELEVIRPRDYTLPSKEFLARWYPGLG